MKETEVTVEVLDTMQNIQKALEENGCEVMEQIMIIDTYFSKFDIAVLKSMSFLEIMENSLIIREISDEHPRTYLIYKKKELDKDDNVIFEEKFNITVSGRDQAINIFELAGLTRWCDIVNKTTVYKKGKHTFVLQDIENLGVFIEFEEDEYMIDLTETQKLEYLKDFVCSLGVNIGSDFSCKKAYMKFLKENN